MTTFIRELYFWIINSPEETLMNVGIIFATIFVFSASVKILSNTYYLFKTSKAKAENEEILLKFNREKIKNAKLGKRNNLELEEYFVHREDLPRFSGLGYDWLEYKQGQQDVSEDKEMSKLMQQENYQPYKEKEKEKELTRQSLF